MSSPEYRCDPQVDMRDSRKPKPFAWLMRNTTAYACFYGQSGVELCEEVANLLNDRVVNKSRDQNATLD